MPVTKITKLQKITKMDYRIINKCTKLILLMNVFFICQVFWDSHCMGNVTHFTTNCQNIILNL